MLTGAAGVATVGLTNLAVLLVLQAAAFVVSRRLGRVNIVDVTWGLGFALVALVAVAFAVARDGAAVWHVYVVAAVVVAWGSRLAIHIGRESAGRGEDQRYLDMLAKHDGLHDDGTPKPTSAFTRVFLLQAAAQWVVSLPVQALAFLPTHTAVSTVLVVAGVALAVCGLLFEAVADAQLSAFKHDPNRGSIMDRGVWSWTRHPNYFGDACVWWGLWLSAVATGWGALTVVSPLLMTYFLVWGTGARLMEKHMSGRPGWDDYVERTSFFVPWPPKW